MVGGWRERMDKTRSIDRTAFLVVLVLRTSGECLYVVERTLT